jgi:hypothetical protein
MNRCTELQFPHRRITVCLRSLVSRPYGQVSKPDRPNFAAQGIPGNNRAVMVRTPRYKFTRYIDGGEELDDLQA